MDANNYNAYHNHVKFKRKVAQCIRDNSKSPAVRHHNIEYGGHFPIWVIIDYFSLGMLSYFYSDLPNKDESYISFEYYGTSYQVVSNWLRCLTDLRNRCAHYSRLYYWIFSSIPLAGRICQKNCRRLDACR